jgi:hypothetical protein
MSIRRAVAAPCFADDPADLVRLAVEAEGAVQVAEAEV